MKVVIATSVNPFVQGGSTYIVDSLDAMLRSRQHDVETFEFPFSDDANDVLTQMMGIRLLDLSESGGRLITIRTPSHLLRHANKVNWFVHHYRSAYDLWGTKYQTLPHTPEGSACRDAIIAADNVALREARTVFCNSRVVQQRLKRFNGIESEVLYPPLMNADRFRCNSFGDYLLYFSRLTHHKRQWLAIEGLRLTKSSVRLVIAGAPDPGCEPYVEELRALIARYKLGGRVTLLSKWIPDEEKVRLFSDCLAAVYLPFDEDSYGYPSLEAYAARKPVLTTTDSGGTVELVTDGLNGLVTPADPQLLAEAMDRLYLNRPATQQMGAAGQARMDELGINWDHVIGRLLA